MKSAKLALLFGTAALVVTGAVAPRPAARLTASSATIPAYTQADAAIGLTSYGFTLTKIVNGAHISAAERRTALADLQKVHNDVDAFFTNATFAKTAAAEKDAASDLIAVESLIAKHEPRAIAVADLKEAMYALSLVVNASSALNSSNAYLDMGTASWNLYVKNDPAAAVTAMNDAVTLIASTVPAV